MWLYYTFLRWYFIKLDIQFTPSFGWVIWNSIYKIDPWILWNIGLQLPYVQILRNELYSKSDSIQAAFPPICCTSSRRRFSSPIFRFSFFMSLSLRRARSSTVVMASLSNFILPSGERLFQNFPPSNWTISVPHK